MPEPDSPNKPSHHARAASARLDDPRLAQPALAGALAANALDTWVGPLETALRDAAGTRHGKLAAWLKALEAMPPALMPRADFGDTVRLEVTGQDTMQAETGAALRALRPWRKGPFTLCGVHIDAEWRSDLKWARIRAAASPFANRRILDVGCGNGYYAWRARGAGAMFVLGLDPSPLFQVQFQAMKQYLPDVPVFQLPLADAAIPATAQGFDTVLSMGVLYHRRDVSEHLGLLHSALRPGGELVLETLVIDEPGDEVLEPVERYAAMRNVWALPSPTRLLGWLSDAGFRCARVADLTPTTGAEQRRTPWITGHSLAEFLDPANPRLTREGYPAPVRAVVVAERA